MRILKNRRRRKKEYSHSYMTDAQGSIFLNIPFKKNGYFSDRTRMWLIDVPKRKTSLLFNHEMSHNRLVDTYHKYYWRIPSDDEK